MDVKIIFLTMFLVIISACNQANAREPDFFGANFSLSSCVQNAGDADALHDFMTTGMRINNPLPPELANHFLNGSDGTAWSFQSPDGNYAVVYRDDGLCTVFIKETDVAKYIKYMNESIKRISEKSDWTFSTNKIPMFAVEDELKTYEFTVSLPDKKVRVVMSAITKVKGNYQVAFSATLL
ncbi:NMCC_0638 family (lipo)protein [Methylophaga nitratireducenticrescens]|uniref:NMCC_0638 family (lipo)protein n=1 Tax=Methylophaga nitratireducenticrescens TaxID=754476 RepID=UPI000CDC0352|nr:hypothetical protein [Methylophaga nitratireducenticrescens]AUZ83141.1 hypothetical protein CDW43_00455 [Methylophaga nitratireducenticrescens]